MVGKALRWYAVTHICRRNIFKPMPRYWTKSGYVKTQIGHSQLEKNAPLTQGIDSISGSGGFRTHDQGIMRPLTAYPFDFRADLTEFFLDVFVAAVEVVDAFDDGFAACNQACHDEAGGGAQVGRHDDGAR